MKKDEDIQKTVKVSEDTKVSVLHEEQDMPRSMADRYRRPLIYVLMAVVFVGCLYLIYKPSAEDKDLEQAGINDSIPQATGAGMESDKQKAYEDESLEQLQLQKRKSLQSLSDFWNADSTGQHKPVQAGSESALGLPETDDNTGASLRTYKTIKSTLGGFYESDTDNGQMKKELDALREQLSQKAAQPVNPMQNQLALMEKSYQMAAKYFPGGNGAAAKDSASPRGADRKLLPLLPKSHDEVTSLTQGNGHQVLGYKDSLSIQRNDQRMEKGDLSQKNSLLACIHQDQKITGEGTVKLRLLEGAQINGIQLPEGTLLTAGAKLQANRLSLKIVSIEAGGSIIPVEIIVYDLDGQQGLQVPFSPGSGAMRDIAANMGQSAGTNMMLTRSAGQQVAADLSRGVVQGVSGYFSKTVKAQKVALKAGYQVLLVSKK